MAVAVEKARSAYRNLWADRNDWTEAAPSARHWGLRGCDPGGMKSHQVSDEGGYAAGRNKCYPLGRHAWQHHR